MKLGILASERGATLIVCVLVLIVLSLIGSAAIMTSSTENKITHSYRKSGTAFFAADGGQEYSQGIVQYFIYESPAPGSKDSWRSDIVPVVQDTKFINEILGVDDVDDPDDNDGAIDIADTYEDPDDPDSQITPDIIASVEDHEFVVDVDRMNKDYAVGGNAEWGSEGGMSMGSGEGVAIFYRIDSKGQYSNTNTRSNVETLYRHLL
jgi:hypothetical protein